MTQMLASVTTVAEADIVMQAGVDIVDLKDPNQGALGALPTPQIRAIVHHIARRLPVSATIGDLPSIPAELIAATRRVAATGVDFVKVGIFSTEDLHTILRALTTVTSKHALIAVLFADRQPPLTELTSFAAAGFRGIMLDTAGKRAGRLLHYLDSATLVQFVEHAKELDLLCGLAGSLTLQDLPQLLRTVTPDYLGFRGSLCSNGDRGGSVDSTQALKIRTTISELFDQLSTADSMAGYGRRRMR